MPALVSPEDLQRWMLLERRLRANSKRYMQEREERKESLRADDAARVAEVFALFDYEKHGALPMADLPMILKAVGCDDATCAATTIEGRGPAEKFNVDELAEVAAAALETGRDGASEESAAAAFQRFSTSTEGGVNVLDAQGLRLAFEQSGTRMTAAEAEELLLYCDLDGDGIIGEADWQAIMRFISDTQ